MREFKESEYVTRIRKFPGRYALTELMGWITQGRYILVDVDEDGNIHQLNKNLERDGILEPDGWRSFGPMIIVLDARSLDTENDTVEHVKNEESQPGGSGE